MTWRTALTRGAIGASDGKTVPSAGSVGPGEIRAENFMKGLDVGCAAVRSCGKRSCGEC